MHSSLRMAGLTAALLLMAPFTTPVAAEVAPSEVTLADGAAALRTALRLDDVLSIMREEGISYGKALEDDLFPGAGGESWQKAVSNIYDLAALERVFYPPLGAEIDRIAGVDLREVHEFFTSPLGRRVVELENSARRAQLDEAVDDASREQAREMEVSNPARFALLQRFVAANDLIDSNVVGTLNSNAQFYFGMNEGKAFPDPMSEAEVLSDVAQQEGDIRAETEEWVMSYLAMAYGSLSDQELVEYLAFSESTAGHALNRALFAAYDEMFANISWQLGLAAARFIRSQEL